MLESLCSSTISSARPGVTETSVEPSVIKPWRASDVHDSSVRRIDTITPDINCPKPHDNAPGAYPAVRESNDNIPNGSQRVRVQTVNAKLHRKKMRLMNLIGAVL